MFIDRISGEIDGYTIVALTHSGTVPSVHRSSNAQPAGVISPFADGKIGEISEFFQKRSAGDDFGNRS